MALREFTDGDGVTWQVWNIQAGRVQAPTRSEPERRKKAMSDYPNDRRRRIAERRRLSLTPGLDGGWLCFQSEREKRRLNPIPPDWEECSEQALGGYCTQATSVQRRRA